MCEWHYYSSLPNFFPFFSVGHILFDQGSQLSLWMMDDGGWRKGEQEIFGTIHLQKENNFDRTEVPCANLKAINPPWALQKLHHLLLKHILIKQIQLENSRLFLKGIKESAGEDIFEGFAAKCFTRKKSLYPCNNACRTCVLQRNNNKTAVQVDWAPPFALWLRCAKFTDLMRVGAVKGLKSRSPTSMKCFILKVIIENKPFDLVLVHFCDFFPPSQAR